LMTMSIIVEKILDNEESDEIVVWKRIKAWFASEKDWEFRNRMIGSGENLSSYLFLIEHIFWKQLVCRSSIML
jgi:predicted RNA-binding protein with PUA domain